MTTLPQAFSESKAIDTERPSALTGTRAERLAFYYFMGSVALSVIVLVFIALTV